MRLFPCYQPKLFRRPQTMQFLDLHLNKILFTRTFMVHNCCYSWKSPRVYAFYSTKFDTFGHDKYISYVEKIYHIMVRPKNFHLRRGNLTSQVGISG